MSIKAEGLAKTFGEMRAVDDFTLEVAPGEIFGLVGPDGAGKTTVMRLLASLLAPTSGAASVAGFDVARQSEAVKEAIGYMSQRFGLYPDLTVRENIVFYADIYGVPRKEREARMERLLGFSNLTPFQKRLAQNLSGGMKQKLGLACALIHTPKVLLLDEPTNGVDPVSRRDFWRILYQLLGEGVTIFVATSYMDEAERCSRIGLMHSGRLKAVGTPAQIKTLMKGDLIEVRHPRTREAAKVLRDALPEGRVQTFGDRLHVGAGEGEIRAILAEAGLEPPVTRSIEPSLEDVFLSIMAEGGAPGQ